MDGMPIAALVVRGAPEWLICAKAPDRDQWLSGAPSRQGAEYPDRQPDGVLVL